MSELIDEPPLSPAAMARSWLPFAAIVLIWGSTWLVITGQLGVVPPSWSVAYRFLIGSATMFVVALATRTSLRLTRADLLMVATVGVCLFGLNFNFVYRAEQHVTSGLVAVVFALLVLPNAILARIFLGQGVSRPFFAGSAVALVGIALLFAHELRQDPNGPGEVALGIAMTFSGVLAASVGNVIQATDRARALPMPTMLAWAMLVGGLADSLFAWITTGPPVFDTSPVYVAGLLYLAVIASALAFTLYFAMIRRIGPARAAYTSVLIPVQAMALSTLFERYVWGLAAALGGALVLLGLVIALRARNPAR